MWWIWRGQTNISTQTVSLDTTAPDAPTSIIRTDDEIEVGFSSTGVAEGDSLSLSVGDYFFTHTLTADEISSGRASVAIPSDILSKTNSLSPVAAGIFDAVGNRSHYARIADDQEDFENFNIDNSIFTSIEGGGFSQNYTGDQWGWAVQRNTVGTFNLKHETSEVFLTYTASNGVGAGVEFFNSAGESIGSLPFVVDPVGGEFLHNDLLFVAPPGESIAYFEVTNGDDGRTTGLFISQVTVPGSLEYFYPETLNVNLESGAVIGGEEDDMFAMADVEYFNGGDSLIGGGAGTDTLNVTGANQILNFSEAEGKISSIEIIDITGTGNNTLSLSLGDVLEQGENSLFTADEATQMMIKGNSGDVVNLDDLLLDGTDPGEWATAGTATVAGVTYNVFQHTNLDAQLLIQDGVTTNLV